MYYTFGDNLEANLEVFIQAEYALRRSLDDYFESHDHDGGDHWISDTNLATDERENIRLTYLSWHQARLGIDSVRERIAEKDEKDKAEKST